MATLETTLEKKLVIWAKAQGGMALKGATQFDTGYPDRIIYVPGAHAHVEVKGTSTSYHLGEKQKLWAGRIIASKSPYFIIESEEQLERFKVDVYVDPSTYTVNVYCLNGFQLFLYVHESTGSYSVISCNDGGEHQLLTGFLSDNLTNTIYRIFKALKEKYPHTNYEDM